MYADYPEELNPVIEKAKKSGITKEQVLQIHAYINDDVLDIFREELQNDNLNKGIKKIIECAIVYDKVALKIVFFESLKVILIVFIDHLHQQIQFTQAMDEEINKLEILQKQQAEGKEKERLLDLLDGNFASPLCFPTLSDSNSLTIHKVYDYCEKYFKEYDTFFPDNPSVILQRMKDCLDGNERKHVNKKKAYEWIEEKQAKILNDSSKEPVTDKNPEFTARRRALAVHYLDTHFKINKMQDTTILARFTTFLTGNSYSNLLRHLGNPLNATTPNEEKALKKDLEYVKNQFEKLGLLAVINLIDKDLHSF